MTTAVVNKRTLGQNDDETVWDHDLRVGQRVEVVGFFLRDGYRLCAVIIHPDRDEFYELPAWFLTPETAAVPA